MAKDKETNAQFELAYEKWLSKHLKESDGERKRKLLNGVGHAQKQFLLRVWWPLFTILMGLLPEFEVRDFKDGFRYIDFVWILGNCKIAIEIDGFGPHWRNADRWQFADHLHRQNQLIIDGWIILRFSYDDIMEHPRRCQQIILQAKGKWNTEKTHTPAPNPIDRAILDFAIRMNAPFTPSKAAEQLGWHRVTITRRTRNLAKAGLLIPASSGSIRTNRYMINLDVISGGEHSAVR